MAETSTQADTSSSKTGIVGKVIKGLGLLVGGLGTVLCLMSLVGYAVDNVWVGFGVGALVALVLPLLIVGKLLPDDVTKRPQGLIGDVYALCWLGFLLLYTVAGNTFTRAPMAAQGQRFAAAGLSPLATVSYALAAVEPQAPAAATPDPGAAPASSGSAASSALVASSAAPASSGSAAAATSAAPSASAGAASASASASTGPAPSVSAEAAPDKPEQLTPAALFKKWAPSVVTIATKQAAGIIKGGGTGFLIDEEGIIATNSHVIAGADKAEIRFKDGARYSKIIVLADDGLADLAILSIKISEPDDGDEPEVEPVQLGDSDDIEVGERAISIGNPLGLEHTLTTGEVSARRKFQGRAWIQMSTPISPGNSGGPVFNTRGQVIGVSTASIGAGGRAQNLNLAVPINVLKAMIKPEYPDKHELGKKSGSQW